MKHGKILVVDDNQGIMSALKMLLPAHFAQVEIIPSPKGATKAEAVSSNDMYWGTSSAMAHNLFLNIHRQYLRKKINVIPQCLRYLLYLYPSDQYHYSIETEN